MRSFTVEVIFMVARLNHDGLASVWSVVGSLFQATVRRGMKLYLQ